MEVVRLLVWKILNTFGGDFRQSLRNTNIGLYYAGQLLIAFSLLLI